MNMTQPSAAAGETRAPVASHTSPKARWTLVAATLLWLLAVGAGLRAAWDYESAPGRAAGTKSQWPAGSRIAPAPDRATLVLLGHPQCPCTRASIGELAQLMARGGDKVTAYVLFVKPPGTPAGWEKTDLWRSAAAIPGVQVRLDEEGREARRFHVSTSGQTLLFDRAGQLRFSGGITSARGHAGDNAGRDAVVSLLETGTATRTKTPVFGCALRSPDADSPDVDAK